MKTLIERFSVTKLVFLILTLVLCFVTIWNTVHWLDNQIFETVLSMTFAFYFWQKALKYDSIDSLVEEEPKEVKEPAIWFDLSTDDDDDDE